MTWAAGTQRVAFDHHEEEAERLMKFRLTYEGPLKHEGGIEHKHEIRKEFHKQLKHLWTIYPGLKEGHTKQLYEVSIVTAGPNFAASLGSDKTPIDKIAENYNRFGFRFVPLATKTHLGNIPRELLIVSLDILFLRSGEPGSVIRSADIDGRLKTIFDALRMPEQRTELPQGATPDQGEDPFYVLVDDDRIIGNVSLTTDWLLQPTPKAQYGLTDKHDARVVVTVEISVLLDVPAY